MNQTLAKSAQSVQDTLNHKGLKCKVVELPSSARTAADAALSLGCEVAQIVKSLIFQTQGTGRPVLILASGANRVNEKAIEAHIGEKIIKADADFTREVTGFAIGGIPPIGHKQVLSLTLIDEDLLKFDNLWAAAGTPNAVFNISSQDLLSILEGEVIAIN